MNCIHAQLRIKHISNRMKQLRIRIVACTLLSLLNKGSGCQPSYLKAFSLPGQPPFFDIDTF